MLFTRPAAAALLALLVLSACEGTPEDVDLQTDTAELVETTTSPDEPREARLNLNTTPEADFVPLVGERMAHEFEEYRPYISIQQFRREMAKYVGDEEIAGYEDLVFVPIDRNASDAETLAQLPGVELDEAELLIEARPFESNVAFIAALEPLVMPEEQDAAAVYLVAE